LIREQPHPSSRFWHPLFLFFLSSWVFSLNLLCIW